MTSKRRWTSSPPTASVSSNTTVIRSRRTRRGLPSWATTVWPGSRTPTATSTLSPRSDRAALVLLRHRPVSISRWSTAFHAKRRLVGAVAACETHHVSAGRGTLIAAASALVVAGALLVTPIALADSGTAQLSSKSKHRTKFVFLKAKVLSDGFVTPGQPEAISISRMAPKARIAVFLEAPPTTIQCGELYFCDPAPAAPAPGSPPFVADAKGRAVLTFVMPDSYYLETDPFNPKIRTPVAFADQQRIHIDVQGGSKVKNVRRASFGFARATVHR